MLFESTRGKAPHVSCKQAILRGLAADGGLYVPRKEDFQSARIPAIQAINSMPYAERAFEIVRPFLPGYDQTELMAAFRGAYTEKKFASPSIAPVSQIHNGLFALELYHGPTMAFKDMALQLLPSLLLMAARAEKLEKEIVILAATSGDTGKAALSGFADAEGARCVVFYPKNGVSRIQELQMLSQAGKNVHVIGVNGNFDDAQSGVKAIFSDRDLNSALSQNGKVLSSANSINWGRLAPQISYYFSAFADLVSMGHPAVEPVNFVVPTGNFGNILAAYYASKLGLPIHRLICASNKNNVLTDFIITGVYDRNRPIYTTQSPSMDILVSSNLERYLHWSAGRARVTEWMDSLRETGRFDAGADFAKDMSGLFWAGWASDEDGREAIASLYRGFGYVSDPHTAVGYSVYRKYVNETGDAAKTVLVSTASPYKFGRDVAQALLGASAEGINNEFEYCRMIERHTGLPMPDSMRELENAPILHTTVCDPSNMKETLMRVINEHG